MMALRETGDRGQRLEIRVVTLWNASASSLKEAEYEALQIMMTKFKPEENWYGYQVTALPIPFTHLGGS